MFLQFNAYFSRYRPFVYIFSNVDKCVYLWENVEFVMKRWICFYQYDCFSDNSPVSLYLCSGIIKMSEWLNKYKSLSLEQKVQILQEVEEDADDEEGKIKKLLIFCIKKFFKIPLKTKIVMMIMKIQGTPTKLIYQLITNLQQAINYI